MKASLRFYLYGTIAPDVRNLVADDNSRLALVPSPPTGLYLVDTCLRGGGETQADPHMQTVVASLYEEQPSDIDLVQFVNDLCVEGARVEVIMPPIPLLGEYRAILPAGVPTFTESEATLPGRLDRFVLVSRQMSHVERAIRQGIPAIHYQSASRLRRELALRGSALQSGAPRAYPANGG